jgi:hypothetical protein
MNTTASVVGTPLRCNQNIGGADITAMKTDKRNGTSIVLAARIPAIIITRLASTTKKLTTEDFVCFSCTRIIVYDLRKMPEPSTLQSSVCGAHFFQETSISESNEILPRGCKNRMEQVFF